MLSTKYIQILFRLPIEENNFKTCGLQVRAFVQQENMASLEDKAIWEDGEVISTTFLRVYAFNCSPQFAQNNKDLFGHQSGSFSRHCQTNMSDHLTPV